MHAARRRTGAVVLGCLLLGGMLATPLPAVARVSAASAAPPAAAPAPDALSSTVDLGRYAVNGSVRAAVVDAATGNTYLGGDFTEIGIRTGSVAIVDPPGTSDGPLRSDSPEILGRVVAVFADDQPGDPGLFVVGRISAIDGVKVGDAPVHRLHRVSGDWVRDTSWAVDGDCTTGSGTFPIDGTWIATPTQLVYGGYAGPGAMGDSTTGLTVVDRATGAMRIVAGDGCPNPLLPSIPQLPGLGGCSSKTYCYAFAGSLAYDPASNRVLVGYHYAVGDNPPSQYDALASYDLTPGTGGRRWFRLAQVDPAVRAGSVEAFGFVPGHVLVRGIFPIDAGLTDEASISRLLFLDADDGSIEGRWSTSGEQDPSTGALVGPATACETHEKSPQSAFTSQADETFGWVSVPTTLCRYGVSGGSLTSEALASLAGDFDPGRRLPSAVYTSDTTTFLVGSDAAIDVATGDLADWDPGVAMRLNAQAPSVTVVDGSIVLGGDFSFARGASMHSLAALDPTFAPLAGFTSPLDAPVNQNEGVGALAFDGGRLVVGGERIHGGRSLIAVDPATGAVDPWDPGGANDGYVDSLAVGPDGDLWAVGSGVRHHASLATGGAPLPAPSIGCLEAPVLVDFYPSSPTCVIGPDAARVQSVLVDEDGRIYLAGAFGTVDGVARRGLARLTPAGDVDDWDPDLLGVLPFAAGAGLMELAPASLAVLGERLIVGGMFSSIVPYPSGGASISPISPMLVFSTTSGSLVRPTDPERVAWFPIGGWSTVAYDMVHTDAGLVVAFGDPGMGVFDATTLDWDATASAPYFDPTWWLPAYGNAIYALALPGSSQGTLAASAVGSPGKLVIGGAIARWKDRSAGNVIRTTIGADTVAPTATGPRAVPRAGFSLTSAAVPVKVLWTGADTHGSGVATYDLAVSVSGGAYAPVKTGLASPTIDTTFASGRTYRFRVRARDFAGNLGTWVSGATLSGSLVQQTSTAIRSSTGWTTLSNTSYSGGSAKARSIAGAAVSYTFTGRGVALVSTLGPTRGQVKVYVDGHYVRTLDLKAATVRYRAVAWSWGWTTSGTHTVRLVVVGTKGRPRVEIDAFAIVR